MALVLLGHLRRCLCLESGVIVARVRRVDSPESAILGELCTTRSRIASA